MSHRAIYGIVAAVFGVLLVVMLLTYNYNKSSDEALAKARLVRPDLVSAIVRRSTLEDVFLHLTGRSLVE